MIRAFRILDDEEFPEKFVTRLFLTQPSQLTRLYDEMLSILKELTQVRQAMIAGLNSGSNHFPLSELDKKLLQIADIDPATLLQGQHQGLELTDETTTKRDEQSLDDLSHHVGLVPPNLAQWIEKMLRRDVRSLTTKLATKTSDGKEEFLAECLNERFIKLLAELSTLQDKLPSAKSQYSSEISDGRSSSRSSTSNEGSSKKSKRSEKRKRKKSSRKDSDSSSSSSRSSSSRSSSSSSSSK